jgi:hypothetical protein
LYDGSKGGNCTYLEFNLRDTKLFTNCGGTSLGDWRYYSVLEGKIEELEAEGLKLRTRVQRARRLEPMFVCGWLGVLKQRST